MLYFHPTVMSQFCMKLNRECISNVSFITKRVVCHNPAYKFHLPNPMRNFTAVTASLERQINNKWKIKWILPNQKTDSLPFKRPLLKIHLKTRRKKERKKHKRIFEFSSHILPHSLSPPFFLTLYLYSQIKFSPYPFQVPIIIFIDSLWKTILPPYISTLFSHSVVVDLFGASNILLLLFSRRDIYLLFFFFLILCSNVCAFAYFESW